MTILLLPLLAYIFWSDLKYHRIPNKALVVLAVLSVIIAFAEYSLASHLIGGLFGLLAMMVLKLLAPRGVGTGDVKLSGVAGLIVGVEHTWLVFALSWVIAAAAVVYIQRKRTITPTDRFPFGSAICVATAAVVIFTAI